MEREREREEWQTESEGSRKYVCVRGCMSKWAVAIKFANRGALRVLKIRVFSFVIKACLHTPLTSLCLLGCLVSGSNPAFVADMDRSVSAFNSLSRLCFCLCLTMSPFLTPAFLSVTKLELSSPSFCSFPAAYPSFTSILPG